jgi:DNA-binding GntR family transcriptional regulator
MVREAIRGIRLMTMGTSKETLANLISTVKGKGMVFPRLTVASVSDIVAAVSNVSDNGFQDIVARAPSLPGLIQRLEEIIALQSETRQRGDVSEFDYIGKVFVLLN